MIKNGWNYVTAKTEVFVDGSTPVLVMTTARNFDAALDDVREYLDEPNLVATTHWDSDCGPSCRDPECAHAMRASVGVRS